MKAYQILLTGRGVNEMKKFDSQEERLDFLVDKFKEDSERYRDIDSGNSYDEKRKILRSLMNIRMPGKMDDDVVKVQDEFLREEAREKGIVKLSDIMTVKEQYGSNHPFGDKISVWQGDITRLEVGAIVNAANSQMLGCFIPCHGCIDNAIHSSAGIELREECSRLMKRKRNVYGPEYEEPAGQAMVTPAYNLPAEYVIHTVGPVVSFGLTEKLKQDLRNCYKSVLKCCVENNIKSVAFCCISTGEFHFPNKEAAEIAVEEVTEFLKEQGDNFERIIFNVFKDMDKRYYQNRF